MGNSQEIYFLQPCDHHITMSDSHSTSFAAMFTQLEAGDDSIYLKISEGGKRTPKRIPLPLAPLAEQLHFAGAYMNCNNGQRTVHERGLSLVAQMVARELTVWADWINREIAPSRHSIKLYFTDGLDVDATVQEESGIVTAKERTTVVWMSLGSLPLLFGIANRFALSKENHLDQSGLARSADFHEWEKFQRWQPEVDPIGILEFDPDGFILNHTYQIVSDACVLMFLHEVAHACQAHMSVKEVVRQHGAAYPRYRRAAEADADWGAGWLFIRGQKQSEEASNEIVSRLAFAANCHYLSFQYAYKGSGDVAQLYHMPATRSQITFRGGNQAWGDLGGDARTYHKAFMDAILKMPLFELFGPMVMKSWIPFGDKRVSDDFRAYQTISLPLIYEITRRCVKLRSSPWAPATRPPNSKYLWEKLIQRV